VNTLFLLSPNKPNKSDSEVYYEEGIAANTLLSFERVLMTMSFLFRATPFFEALSLSPDIAFYSHAEKVMTDETSGAVPYLKSTRSR